MIPVSEKSFRFEYGKCSLAIIFAFMILFIQEGLTYYISVQTLALAFFAAMLLHAGFVISLSATVLAVYVLFSLLLLSTAVIMPESISQNSPNIVVTTIGVLGYVALILAMTCMRPVRSEWLLQFYQTSALAIILIIATLVVVTDLGLISGMTREYFLLRNVALITNYSSLRALEKELRYRMEMGIPLDIDLFYGEQSFLSLVLFVSMVSYLIASRALGRFSGEIMLFLPLLVGVACMLYIKSFSSLFYSVILLGLVAKNALSRKQTVYLTGAKVMVLLLLLAAICWVVIETLPYYWYRLSTLSQSNSFQERFGIIFNFLPQDYLLGLHERDRMPPAGLHNGLIYVVMIAGIGGIGLLAYLIHYVVRLAYPLGLAALSVLTILAVFSQNGAIFSPNKLVIMSFLLIPLNSARSKSGFTQIN